MGLKELQKRGIKDEQRLIDNGFAIMQKACVPIVEGQIPGQQVSYEEDKVKSAEFTFVIRKEIRMEEPSEEHK